MTIEAALASLQSAVEANTAALLKAGGTTAASTSKPAAGKEKPAAAKNEHTREEMVAALTAVKEKFDLDATRALFAPTEKMKDIAEGDIDKVYKAAKAKLVAAEEEM